MVINLFKKLKYGYVWPVVAIWLIYCTAAFLSQETKTAEHYGISMFVLYLLLVSLYLPILACWLFAVSGWWHLRTYTLAHKDKNERRGYMYITLGLLLLTFFLIGANTVETILLAMGVGKYSPLLVLIRNYSTVCFQLASFGLMFVGSLKLLQYQHKKVPLLSKILSVGLPVSLFTAYYSYLVFSNPTRGIPKDPGSVSTFYLPDPLIIVTIVIPIVITWIAGLWLVLNLEYYSRYTKTTDRRSVINIYNGIILIVCASIVSQAVGSIGGDRVGTFGLGMTLLIIYTTLGLIAIGFGLISKGAHNLRAQKPATMRTKRQRKLA